ncbi:hypothetical protein N656DRAFT_784825 [Canariomyces notabilis]|uniref:Coiled-coil domain-containing protein 16 n=1 Tax=Canariomyces notabilis TaxID=2074819 RepID=A0AAN6QCZ6_9PEZI|nr:hypothetical protein N656DRAFT_784825 [Canariomyces arenarius]
MADVRALLRQQRAARRIEHPHAAYSDSGKLLCTLCHEHVKTEALWDGHLKSACHRQRLQNLHKTPSDGGGSNGYAGFVGEGSERNGDGLAPSTKRKLADSDEEMGDHAGEGTARKKRSRAELKAVDTSREDVAAAAAAAKKDDVSRLAKPVTPPPARRTSGTPTIGVEIQIPSRPATPGPSSTPMATTPIAAPLGRSPLIPDEPNAPRQHQKAQPLPAETDAQPQEADKAPATAPPVNEDEWAAFEAELVHGTATPTNKPAKPAIAALDSDAVISAPVMTAAEIAAKSKEEEAAKRRALVDIQLEDEKEEATRALETEFEVMEELEARARKLRERREALRLQGGGGGTGTAVTAAGDVEKNAPVGKENAANLDEEEEEEEEEEEDDWDGFRFRA